MECQRMVKGLPENKRANGLAVVPCESKARVYVAAYGGKGWDGYFCEKHAVSILKRRLHLVKKYKQNVVVRYITPYDKNRRKGKR